MSSEWMKVMLDEIERKKAEAEQAQEESERRRDEERTPPAANAPGDDVQG
jgi:hypothetical protein